MSTAPTSTPMINVQGVPVPQSQINPDLFFKYTRRQRGQMSGAIAAWAGFGNPDVMSLKQVGILGAIDVKFEGSLVVTLNSGTVASTMKWPYSLAKQMRVSANGQSNLILANGTLIKARQFISQPGLTDRGVPKGVDAASPGTTVYQDTLSLNGEAWGVGQNVTAIAGGTYPVILKWRIPIAWDLIKLFGALYLQTAATAVSLEIDWAPVTDLFTLTGAATVTMTGGWTAEGVVFNIPQVGGQPVIPDLTTFHAFNQTSLTSVGQTTNTPVLAGQGVGKQLMRIIGNVWSGATYPGAPLAMNATNYGNIGWGYGLSETPELWEDGDSMRLWIEESYGMDMHRNGIFCVDFAQHWAFRDSVNEGDATNLNLILQVLASVTNPRLEYAQEVMIKGASAA